MTFHRPASHCPLSTVQHPLWPMAHVLWLMGHGHRDPDLPLSAHCKTILLPGGARGLGCPPALPGATNSDTWLPVGAPFRRLRPRAPGCTPLGGALGSSQGVFPVLLALPCQPFFSPRGDASPSVLGTRPPSVAHLFCAPSTGGCILAQGIQCMHRRSPMQIPSAAYHACCCVQDPVN